MCLKQKLGKRVQAPQHFRKRVLFFFQIRKRGTYGNKTYFNSFILEGILLSWMVERDCNIWKKLLVFPHSLRIFELLVHVRLTDVLTDTAFVNTAGLMSTH